MFRIGADVFVPGTEWPGTEWDVPGAWFSGTVVRIAGDKAFIAFEDCDEELDFDLDELAEYGAQYDWHRFECLMSAAAHAM